MFDKFWYLITGIAIHSLYLYLLQSKIVEYGFLEHDDYQKYFLTYDLTIEHLIVLPFLTYTAGFLYVFELTRVFKYVVSGGWLLFNLFDYIMPESMKYYRKYVAHSLGLLFILLFGVGYFMNLYYLFLCASIVLYWSITLRYSKISKKTL